MGKTIVLINNPSVSSIFLSTGKYRFECWGAQGGIGLTNGVKKFEGGRGAYVSGVIELKNESTFYLYVGGKGEDGNISQRAIGGFNGGGNGGIDGDDDDAGSGGGSSDIRIVNGQWNDEKSILSRIMVAAGGSGSVFNSYGAPGGTLYGYKVTSEAKREYAYSTTNQTNGYSLGIGQNGKDHGSTPSSGSGGGYYGGISVEGINQPNNLAVSSSGTSFVSGFSGCNAVDENGNHTNTPFHYSNLVFDKIIMKDGNEIFPSPFRYKEVGHPGNGAIKISYYNGFDQLRTCLHRNYFRLSFAFLQSVFLLYS